jgi:hypothetical protein
MTIPTMFASPRAAIMVVFAAFGCAVGALAGSIPTVTRDAGIDSFWLGLGITTSAIASVATMAAGGTIARHASNRALLSWGIPGFGLLLFAVLVSAGPTSFFVAYILLGVVMGLVDLFMNAEGAAVEIDMGKPIFTAFHGTASGAMTVLALLASVLSTEIGTWASGMAVIASMAAAWAMVQRFVPARSLARGREARFSAIPNKLPLTLLGITAGLSIAAETTAIMWSAKLLNEQAPDLAAVAGAGAAFFGLCAASLRLVGDRLRAHFGDLPLMIGSILVALAGFVILGQSQHFLLSVASFALVGFGTAVLVPCVFNLAARYVPANRAAAIGFASLVAGVPRILAPWLFGWIVTATSIGFAFGLYAMVMATALVLVVVLRNLR